jgi:hypothetical protein
MAMYRPSSSGDGDSGCAATFAWLIYTVALLYFSMVSVIALADHLVPAHWPHAAADAVRWVAVVVGIALVVTIMTVTRSVIGRLTPGRRDGSGSAADRDA